MPTFSEDQYQTIARPAEASLRIKGSRFLGVVFSVQEPEQFKRELQERSKHYHDATHHCWAYRLLSDTRVVAASSDAGEPPGSAGKPILSVIEGRNLLDTGLVITRYFGGTKLGTGGLARAYADCANMVLDNAETVVKSITSRLALHFEYDCLSRVMSIITQHGASIAESNYGSEILLTITVPVSREADFRQQLIDVCKGHIRFST